MGKKISELKVGDKVIISRFFGKSVSRVNRVTKTLIIVDDVPYRKEDGSPTGEYRCDSIKVATNEEIKAIEEDYIREEILSNIDCFDFSSLSTEKLKQIEQLIND